MKQEYPIRKHDDENSMIPSYKILIWKIIRWGKSGAFDYFWQCLIDLPNKNDRDYIWNSIDDYTNQRKLSLLKEAYGDYDAPAPDFSDKIMRVDE